MKPFDSIISDFLKEIPTSESLINKPIVVGVSGGVDSMVLLSLLQKFWDPSLLNVVHINHELRGEDADADAKLVQSYCKTHSIACEVFSMPVSAIAAEQKQSIETAGREVRRACFERVMDQTGAIATFLAHHRDDLVETVLFNLTRGSKLRGLSGIESWDGTYARPLLSVDKADIRHYAETRHIPFREDASNTSDEYLRNRIRNHIIPELETINPSVRETIATFAEYARELESHLSKESERFLISKSFYEKDFNALSSLTQSNVIEFLYRQENGSNIGLSSGNIEEVRRFILEANGGTEKTLGNLRLEKRGGIIRVAE